MDIESLRNSIMEKLKELNDIEPLAALFESMQGEYAVLGLLAENNNISPSEISTFLGISKARTTAILKTLVKKKFVTVTKSQQDRRMSIVALTQLGKDSFDKKSQQATSFFDDYLLEIGKSDSQKLVSFLDKSIKIAKKKAKKDKT